MLFTTADFAFVFLPITLIAFFVLARYSSYWAAASLCLASVVFYSVSMPVATILLLVSIVLNFALGRAIIAEARVCLMDEPLSNLGAKLRHEMRTEIRAPKYSALRAASYCAEFSASFS